MSIYKIPLPLNILEAARERITWTLNTLPRVCVSFSGGKDSGLMLHLTADLARQMGKKICVLFIDWEAQTLMHYQLCSVTTRVLRRCHRRVLLGCAPAYDAKFPFTIPTRMAVLGT